MILKDNSTIPYLKAFKEGKIKKGIGMGREATHTERGLPLSL